MMALSRPNRAIAWSAPSPGRAACGAGAGRLGGNVSGICAVGPPTPGAGTVMVGPGDPSADGGCRSGCGADCAGDCNADGVFNITDFGSLTDRNGNGLTDPEDLILDPAVSDGVDEESDGAHG